MNKEEILSEIRRVAEGNNGVVPRMDKFRAETGIDTAEWKGKHWARWGDAIREAGLAPNRFGTQSYDEAFLIQKYAEFARVLSALPTKDDLRLRRRNDPEFPSAMAFSRRWSKTDLIRKVLDYCRCCFGFDEVIELCERYMSQQVAEIESEEAQIGCDGYVYLLKSGRFYKIGRTCAPGRREYELGIQLPEQAKRIHVIRTDDPGGIEAYWHKRLEAKRKNGEWFELNAEDIRAFKRRKFM